MSASTRAPVTTSRANPSRRPYVLAALIAVIGVAAATVWLATALVDQVQRPADFARADVPGSVSVTLSQTGPHLVYVEVPRDDAVPRLVDDLSVTDPAGDRVDVREYRLALQYDLADGHLATAVASFDAERTGTYVVTADGVRAVPAGTRIAVGDDLAPALLRAVLPPLLTGLIRLAAALTLALGTLSRHTLGAHR